MFTVLRPESTLSAPPEQSESVRYRINQRACKLVPAGSSHLDFSEVKRTTDLLLFDDFGCCEPSI